MAFSGLSGGICAAASTSESAGGSGARGPPVTGVIHTCIIGWLTRFTLPAAHGPLLSFPTTPPALKHRSV